MVLSACFSALYTEKHAVLMLTFISLRLCSLSTLGAMNYYQSLITLLWCFLTYDVVGTKYD